jgi:response regulator RpfG family c-di-GMP phosphodiesterase
MKQKILLVDDESANLRMLERLFRSDYEPLTASSGAEALDLLTRFDVAMIISDQRMPEMTGIQLLKKAAELRQQTVRIILTGYTDVNDLVEAVNAGVIYKYITKPWVNSDLMQTVQRGMEHYRANKRRHLLLQDHERLISRLNTTVQVTVNVFKEMIAQKHSSMAEHCRRTAKYSALIAATLGLPSVEIEQLSTAAFLHEFPCIRIPFSLDLDKKALNAEQFRSMRERFENGLQMIAAVPDLDEAASIIRYQHEHFDGSGFFDGLVGEKIPLRSQILAVANAFDTRLVQPGIGLRDREGEARQWLASRSGIHFDPRVIGACQSTELMGWKRTEAVPEQVRQIVSQAVAGV